MSLTGLKAQTLLDRLTPSLLAKAFRGELVPTEHTREIRDYEPASLLLERICNATSVETNAPSTRRLAMMTIRKRLGK